MTGRPPDPHDVERMLESTRFEPRASLGAEILGRWRRGERPTPRTGGRRPALRLLVGLAVAGAIALPSTLHPGRLIDHCCQDLDGGGNADDGLLVESRRGSDVRRLAVFEDLDGSRSYTAADLVRFERRGGPAVTGPVAPDDRTAEFCCFDYDGGGPSDDALVIVRRAPDRIAMAAIYEFRGGSGLPALLR